MHLIVWARMAIVLFPKHAPCLFWVCFFPTGLSVLHPAGRPQQYIATRVDRQPAEHRQTRMQVLPHIWNLQRPSCSGCHQSEQTRPLFPSANQRASSSFMPKLIRWRPSDSFVSQIQIEVLHQHVNTVLPMWAREIQDLSFISVSGGLGTWSSTLSLVTSITSTLVVVVVNDDTIVYHIQSKYLHAWTVETVTQQWLWI